MARPSPSLSDLAKDVTDSVHIIEEFFKASSLPSLSLGVDAPTGFPVDQGHPEVQNARHIAMGAARKLVDLLWGAEERVLAHITSYLDFVPLQALYRFNILKAIPIDGSASYKDLSTQTGLAETHVRRLVRSALLVGVLDERNGSVYHNATSAVLLRKPFFFDILAFTADYAFKASTGIIPALERDPELQEPTKAGFNIAFDTTEHFMEVMGNQPHTSKMFANVMKGLASNPGVSYEHILQGYAWEKCGKATVVDVGGSNGQTSATLARAFPDLSFVIQDLPGVIEDAEKSIDPDIRHRFTFMGHDLFTPQANIDAKVYLLRWILHDWPRKYCVQILRAIAAGMSAGSRILVAEILMPPHGVIPWSQERYLVSMDLMMMTLFNAQERTLEEYKDLMKEADPRLCYVNHIQPQNSTLSFVEFGLDES